MNYLEKAPLPVLSQFPWPQHSRWPTHSPLPLSTMVTRSALDRLISLGSVSQG